MDTMSPNELIKRCELNPRFGSELFQTKNGIKRVSVNRQATCEWHGLREGTHCFMDPNADPNPRFFCLRPHALDEFVLGERFG